LNGIKKMVKKRDKGVGENQLREQINEAVKVLEQGGTVVFPTETAYGLAADAENFEAVKRVFTIKGRSPKKAVPLIAVSEKMVDKYVEMDKVSRELGREHWPGPLTLVLPVKDGTELSPLCQASGWTAVRISGNWVAQALTEKLGRPIVATSANRSGVDVAHSVKDVKRQFSISEFKPDLYLDAGALPQRKPSTIIRVQNGEAEVLRQGEIEV